MRDEGVVKNSLKGQKGDGLGDDKVYSNQEVRNMPTSAAGAHNPNPNPDPNPTAGPVVNPNPDQT